MSVVNSALEFSFVYFILCENMFVALCVLFNDSDCTSANGIQVKMKPKLELLFDTIDTKEAALIYDQNWLTIGG